MQRHMNGTYRSVWKLKFQWKIFTMLQKTTQMYKFIYIFFCRMYRYICSAYCISYIVINVSAINVKQITLIIHLK